MLAVKFNTIPKSKKFRIDNKSANKIVKKLKLCNYKIVHVHFLNKTMKCKEMIVKFFLLNRFYQNNQKLLKKNQQKTGATKILSRSHFAISVVFWTRICATGKTYLLIKASKSTLKSIKNEFYKTFQIFEARNTLTQTHSLSAKIRRQHII